MIQADNLTMFYGPVQALKSASFAVRQGEVVGLLGPNGAGKSTTMKILTTYLHPSSGSAKVCGIDILESPLEVRQRIGYLPEVLPLYMDMEVRDYLTFVGRARGLGGARLRDRLDWVVEHCDLRPMYRKVVRDLSKGYKQRTGLGQALIHDPEVVILDEPMSGLDPHQIIEIRQLVRSLARSKTVILSTHIMQEAEEIADRIIIISRGRIVGNGTVAELREQARPSERSKVAVSAPREEVERALGEMADIRRVEFLGAEDGYSRFRMEAEPGRRLWLRLGELALARGWKLGELGHDPLSLEEMFLELTRPQTAGESAAGGPPPASMTPPTAQEAAPDSPSGDVPAAAGATPAAAPTAAPDSPVPPAPAADNAEKGAAQ